MTNQTSAIPIKGYIEYPCGCHTKMFVYEGTVGRTSDRCPKCQKYAIFDFEEMKSYPCQAAQGVAQKLKLKKGFCH